MTPYLNDMAENGELEVDHCPGKFVTTDAITKKTHRSPRCVVQGSCGYDVRAYLAARLEQGGCQHCIGGACNEQVSDRSWERPNARLTMTKQRVDRERGTDASFSILKKGL
jgi:hypothetical protein